MQKWCLENGGGDDSGAEDDEEPDQRGKPHSHVGIMCREQTAWQGKCLTTCTIVVDHFIARMQNLFSFVLACTVAFTCTFSTVGNILLLVSIDRSCTVAQPSTLMSMSPAKPLHG